MAAKNSESPISFWLSLEPFPFNVFVVCGASWQEFLHTLQKKKLLEPDYSEHNLANHAGCCLNVQSVGEIALWLKNKPRSSKSISHLSHEAVHAARYCMDYCGIDQNDATEEVLCYLTDHIVEAILLADGHLPAT